MIPPNEISEKGKRLYETKFQREFETTYPGKYLAIDVTTEVPYVADSPELALETAQQANPKGFFYVVRLGASGVYRVGYTKSANFGWNL